jgi:hypothetical protein
MAWFGGDPGGKNAFGIAALHADGTFDTWCCSSVDEAVRLIEHPATIGIDCQCGGRQPAAAVDASILGFEQRTTSLLAQFNR